MHLGVYLFNIAVWFSFSVYAIKIYYEVKDDREWYLAFITFECGIFSNSVLITSIVYAIYWLHQTGEIIKE